MTDVEYIALHCVNCKFSILHVSAPPCVNHMLLSQCTVHCNNTRPVSADPVTVTKSHTDTAFFISYHLVCIFMHFSVKETSINVSVFI